MDYRFYSPTEIYFGENCVLNNASLLKEYGKKALIVTGRNSAKISGALDDVIMALETYFKRTERNSF